MRAASSDDDGFGFLGKKKSSALLGDVESAAGIDGAAESETANTADKARLYVSNLAWDTKVEDLRALFETFGVVTDTYIPTERAGGGGRPGRVKGFAFVEFVSSTAATEAVRSLNGSSLGGRELTVEFSTAERSKRGPRSQEQSTRLFVSSLSFDTTWESLKDAFRAAGNVTYASVSMRPDGSSKGCGIVSFDSAEEAEAAIEVMNGAELDGRVIAVRKDRQERGRDGRSKRGAYEGSESWAREQVRSRGGSMRAGDWLCPSCNAHVFAGKTNCFHCDEPKPEGAEAVGFRGEGRGGGRRGRGEGQVKPGDWTCPECGANVFARKENCFRCGCGKP